MTIVINEADIGKTEIQLLMDLIFESVGIRVPEQKIQYGKPQALDVRPDVYDDPNTFIPITVDADYDDRYAPQIEKGLLYRRRELASHFTSTLYPIYTATGTFKISAVLSQLNTLLTYPLTMADVVDQTLSAAGLTQITLVANPTSYIWTGKVVLDVSVHQGDLVLMLATTDLEGF